MLGHALCKKELARWRCDADHPFYHNPARLKLGFHIFYFHFHTRSKYLKWSNQTVLVHPLHIYIEFTPIVTYPMQSGPDVQTFLGKQSFVYALRYCRSKGPADVFSVIWPVIIFFCSFQSRCLSFPNFQTLYHVQQTTVEKLKLWQMENMLIMREISPFALMFPT